VMVVRGNVMCAGPIAFSAGEKTLSLWSSATAAVLAVAAAAFAV
jgi:hypothetical protein